MLAELAEVRVPGQPLEIAVAEAQRLFQGRRAIKFAVKRVTAGEIVEDQRVAAAGAGTTAGPLSGCGHVSRAECSDLPASAMPRRTWGLGGRALQESDFDIQLARFFARQDFVPGTTFFGHTTVCIVSMSATQVKPGMEFLAPLGASHLLYTPRELPGNQLPDERAFPQEAGGFLARRRATHL